MTDPETVEEQHISRSLPPVLMYHSVAEYDSDPYNVTVRPARFARQLCWLRLRGWTGVGVGHLLRAHRAGDARGLVGLTFDDGYVDFETTVVELLRRHGFTATVFVLPGRLGGYNGWDGDGPTKPLMTAEQVRCVAARGMEVGSHGLLHRRLSTLPHHEAVEEIHRSRAELEELVQDEVSGFCYPYGDLDTVTEQEVRAAGYSYACAVRPPHRGGLFTLPRIYVGDRDNGPRLEMKRWRAALRESGSFRVGRHSPHGV
ncbi:polysaccharide deacetylase family protein [Actinopolyspora mortivallis]|uniref:polysaccharide deacetylase family protein n=1 Tax=Actinopolyspora mortivallis TaxID=33906 RepID=UPI000365E0BF|nr:polysaccharide deacetylase family protein [Actinopolyspora mortivallis]